jgi:hypothetical protein
LGEGRRATAVAAGEKEDACREEKVMSERRKTGMGAGEWGAGADEWGAGTSPSPEIPLDFREVWRNIDHPPRAKYSVGINFSLVIRTYVIRTRIGATASYGACVAVNMTLITTAASCRQAGCPGPALVVLAAKVLL